LFSLCYDGSVVEFICGQQLTESVDVLSILSTQAMQRFDTFAWFLLKNQTKLNIALALGFDWFITLASYVGSEVTFSCGILEGTAVKKSFPYRAKQLGMRTAANMVVGQNSAHVLTIKIFANFLSRHDLFGEDTAWTECHEQ